MEVIEAIYKRRAVRTYSEKPVDKATVEALLRAATQAPSALNEQPWAFAVMQDIALLKELSDHAKAYFLKTLPSDSATAHLREMLENPDFNIFYSASTLILVCAKSEGMNATEDCCLAAQNLMLAACGMGLGTCPIGFARPWLNLPEVKQELGIPPDYIPVLPIIVGHPKEGAPPTDRKAPEILFWQEPRAGQDYGHAA